MSASKQAVIAIIVALVLMGMAAVILTFLGFSGNLIIAGALGVPTVLVFAVGGLFWLQSFISKY